MNRTDWIMSGIGRWISLSGALVLALGSVPSLVGAGAGSDPEELEALVISGSRLDGLAVQQAHRVFGGVQDPLTLLRGEDWLSFVPGAYLEGSRSSVGRDRIYLRGGEPNAALCLVDGIKVDNPTDGTGSSFSMASMPSLGVDRIDISYGSGSSVHGSGALSGVISIESFGDLDDPESWMSGGFGMHGAWEAQLRGGGVGDWGSGAIHYRQADGGRFFESTRQESRRVSVAYDPEVADGPDLRIRGFWADHESSGFPDDSGGPLYAVLPDPENREGEESGLSVRYALQIDETGGVLHVQGSHYRRTDGIASPGVVPGLRDPIGLPESTVDSELVRWVASAWYEQPLRYGMRVLAGTEWESEEGDSESMVDYGFFQSAGRYDLDRDTHSVFAEANGEWNRWVAQWGVRWNDSSGVGDEWLHRVGVSMDLPEVNSRARLHFSEGFKLPGFYALGNPLVGNPDLAPEQSESWQASWDVFVPAADIIATVGVFRNDYSGMIDFDAGPPPQLVNRGSVRIEGVEVNADWQAPGAIRVRVFGIWLDMDPGVGEAPLRGRPDQRFGLDFDGWLGEHWRWGARVTHTGKRFDSSIPTGDRDLGSYERIDLRLSWIPSEEVEFAMVLENVADRKYEEMVGFRGLGFAPWFTARIKF